MAAIPPKDLISQKPTDSNKDEVTSVKKFFIFNSIADVLSEAKKIIGINPVTIEDIVRNKLGEEDKKIVFLFNLLAAT